MTAHAGGPAAVSHYAEDDAAFRHGHRCERLGGETWCLCAQRRTNVFDAWGRSRLNSNYGVDPDGPDYVPNAP